jgi:hypothetical protein
VSHHYTGVQIAEAVLSGLALHPFLVGLLYVLALLRAPAFLVASIACGMISKVASRG